MLNLLWGVKAFLYTNDNDTNDTIEEVNKIALDQGYIAKDDLVINLSSMPAFEKGKTNTLRVTEI
jgi:pyruvate kinase